MGHAGIDRMNHLVASRERKLLIQAQILRGGEADRNPLVLKPSGDDPGLGLERKILFGTGKFLHETGEAAGAIAAHFADTAVAVMKLPGPIRFSRGAVDQDDEAIGTDTALAIAEVNDLF